MQSVQVPARRTLRWPVAAAAAIAVAAALVLLVWPRSDAPSRAPVRAVAPAPRTAPGAHHAARAGLINGHGLQRADCADWNAGTGDERAAVLGTLRRSVGGATGYGPAVTLSDAAATTLFDRTCAGPYARGWLLYSLYTRAAGFQSLTPQT
jgi:hypothetical protein